MNSPTILTTLALAVALAALVMALAVVIPCPSPTRTANTPVVRPADRALIRDVVDGFHRLAP